MASHLVSRHGPIWQWAWDRHGERYSWAIYAIMFPLVLQIYLVPSFVVVAYEKSGSYVEAAAVTVVAVLVLVYLLVLPGLGWSGLARAVGSRPEGR